MRGMHQAPLINRKTGDLRAEKRMSSALANIIQTPRTGLAGIKVSNLVRLIAARAGETPLPLFVGQHGRS